jgi:hypothetical protein
MIECLVMGDSIAVGIGQHSPQCKTVAKVGITSKNWYLNHKEFITNNNFKKVVISLGSNDSWHITSESLYNIRSKIKADKVVWILTSAVLKPTQRVIIKEIANEFKDITIDISEHISKDGIHPTGKGYKSIANNLRSNI